MSQLRPTSIRLRAWHRPAHWRTWFAWLVFAAVAAASLVLWQVMRYQLQQVAQSRFNVRVAFVTGALRHGFDDYRHALQAAAQYAGETPITPARWQAYSDRLDLQDALPGLQAWFYVSADERQPADITAIVPADHRARLAASSLLKDAAATMARRRADDDSVSMFLDHVGTGRLALVVPVYRQASRQPPVLAGYLGATVRMDAMLDAVAPDLLRDVTLVVRHTTQRPPVTLFDNRDKGQDNESAGPVALRKTVTVDDGGQTLTLTYEATGNFGPVREISRVNVVLVAGAAASLALLWCLLALARSYTDATLEAQRMANDLRNNESRMYGIIQSAMEAVITVDEHQNIVIFNPMAEQIFRCPATEAIGTPLDRFIPTRFRETHRQHIEKFGKTGVSARQMGKDRLLRALRTDGEEFPIEASISQTHDGRGMLYTVLLRDVTERQQVEQALQASRNELLALSARLQSVREEEKTHIARELHDDLGQRLTALKMDVSVAEAMLADTPGDARARLAAMHGLIDETVGAVRRIAADLRPVMLDDLGLAPAVEWLANEFARRYGVHATVEFSEELIELPAQSATALYRIVQEALTNVARHAKATEVTITLVRNDQTLHVKVADNGQGNQQDPTGRPKSFGLIGIRERVRLLGGTLRIFTAPGRGFRLEIQIPYPPTTTLEIAPAAASHGGNT